MTKTKKSRGGEKVSPFLLFENPKLLSLLQEPQIPFSSSGTPDFLSTCLGIDSLSHKESDMMEQLNWTDIHRKNLGSDLGFFPQIHLFFAHWCTVVPALFDLKNCNCSVVLPRLFCQRSVDHIYMGLLPCFLFSSVDLQVSPLAQW